MRLGVVWLVLAGCSGAPVQPAPAGDAGTRRFVGGFGPGGVALTMNVSGGRFADEGGAASEVDLHGRFVFPGIIDSHVHISFYGDEQRHVRGGVAGAVDLAAPAARLAVESQLVRLASGPMLTGMGGYPTQTWGQNGYGWECADEQAAEAAVAVLAGRGAGIIKLALGDGGLELASALAATRRAHELGLKVVAHAISEAAVRNAADIEVDALAHVPLQAIDTELARRFAGKAVITTMAAFGGAQVQVDNLRTLHGAGALILYGTDLGNLPEPGISGEEIQLMLRGGLSAAEVLASMTDAPASFWGIDDVGAIEAGRRATFVTVDEDPLQAPAVLARPRDVYIDGDRTRATQ